MGVLKQRKLIGKSNANFLFDFIINTISIMFYIFYFYPAFRYKNQNKIEEKNKKKNKGSHTQTGKKNTIRTTTKCDNGNWSAKVKPK